MKKARFTETQIVAILKEADSGGAVGEAVGRTRGGKRGHARIHDCALRAPMAMTASRKAPVAGLTAHG